MASLMARSSLLSGPIKLSAPASRLPRPSAPVCPKPTTPTLGVASVRKPCVKAQSTVEPVDRALAAIPYLLPFIDAWNYGRYLFVQYPAIKNLFTPLHGVIASYQNSAYLSIIIFFALYLGVIRNTAFRSFVRWNAMQALLLDVILILPRLIETLVTPPAFGWGATLYKYFQTFVWLFMAIWIVAAVVGCITGKATRIPYVAESADAQA